MKIIFAGSIGRFPVGGHAWVDLQYLHGLQDLGHQVMQRAFVGAADIHAGALADGLEPFQHFDGGGVIGGGIRA